MSLLQTPEGPDTPRVAATAFDPVVGDADALARRLRSLVSEGYRVVLAAEGTGSLQRLHDVLAAEGVDGIVELVVAPLGRGVVLPAAKLALVAEADLTGRRRVHRRARGARRGTDYYDALEPGDYVVHYVHGVGRYVEMKPLTMAGIERDYLSLQFRDGMVYVPTDQVGLRAQVHRRRVAVAQPHGRCRLREAAGAGPQRGAGDRRGARRALPAAAGHARPRVPARHALAARGGGGVPLRGDARPARAPSKR